MNILYVIPARGGSKGIPHKNIKLLSGKPLIFYTIDIARSLSTDDNICVSTDDDEIIKVVENYGLKVPFKRPSHLATDYSGTNEVLVHAIDFYKNKNIDYDVIVLLQPTSPFRRKEHILEALQLYDKNTEMIVSVKESASNPYYNCFEEDYRGYLRISKGDGNLQRRQDAPLVWEYNGSIYVINVSKLMEKGLSKLSEVKKYVMDDLYSIDLDSIYDWAMAELIIKGEMINK